MFTASASASSPAFRRVGTIDNSTATANQACYWNGTDLECNSSNPTITATGLVGIGSTTPDASLDLSQKTDAVSLPVGTTGTRPASGVNGMIRYNSTLPGLEAYINGVWSTLQSSGSTSGVLGVPNGGTGDSTLTAHGVVVGEGTSPLVATSAGAIDTVLVGNGSSADPSFSASPTLSGTITDLQSIGATSTDGMVLQNSTAATSTLNQWSPRVHFSGQGWKTAATAASQAVDMIEELQPQQGTTNPSGNLTWSSSVNGAAYSPLMTLTSGGYVGIGTTSPIAQLQVRTTTNGNFIVNSNTDLGIPTVNISTVNDPDSATVPLEFGASKFNFNGGNVGIGTTSPGSSLQVNGGAAVGYATNTAAPTNGLAVSGAVAVGTTSVPASVTEAVNGLVKVAGTGSEPCTASQVGSIRYNPTANYFELCSYP